MKLINSILIALLVFSSYKSEERREGFSFDIPSIEQEASSIWRTIRDIEFFEKQGYAVKLPDDELIDSLIVKSKNGTFSNNDFSSIYQLLESKVYNESDYKLALEKVNEQKQLISNIIHQIELSKRSFNWEFKMFKDYKVILTLYGSGGSYNQDAGWVTLFTTKEGDFKNYKNPANTIIHEIVHIGMEKSIIQKYKVSHILKERVVDTFVSLFFGEVLPDYKIQSMGETEIDEHLKEKSDLKNLHLIFEKSIE